MIQHARFIVAGSTVVLLLAVAAAPSGAQPGRLASGPRAGVHQAVLDELARSGRSEVLIALEDGQPPDAPDAVLARAVYGVQEAVLATLEPGDLEVFSRPTYIPALAGFVTPAGLERLRAHPAVVLVQENLLLQPQTAEAVPLIGADRVWETYGFTGEGVTVAVLDTGIDSDHADFEGKIVGQQCFASATRSCPPRSTGTSDSAEDEHGHGTTVSGIVASKGAVSDKGVAPGANILAVRVFRDAGGAATNDIVSGLDWVLPRRGPLNVRAINMSLGGGAALGNQCNDQYPTVWQSFQRLVSRGIAIFVATGNGGNPDRVAFPACVGNSIGVGATYDAEYPQGWCGGGPVGPGDITCFTDRGRAMVLLAPGAWISSSGRGGGVQPPGGGTSYAAPMAAGLAALMFEADPDLAPRDVLEIMKDTGVPVRHSESGDMIPRIDAWAAIRAVVPNPPTVRPTETDMPPTVTPTTTATSTGEAPPTDTDVVPTVTPDATATVTEPTPANWLLFLPALSSGA